MSHKIGLCVSKWSCVGKTHRIPQSLPSSVKIVEVGPRDGLQNVKHWIPTNIKKQFINLLADSGLRYIEATAFVSPKWIPQMSDAFELYSSLKFREGVIYPVLVPNLKGYIKAKEAHAHEVSIFMSASETFSKKNTNSTISESYKNLEPVINRCKDEGISVRGYVSCVLGCPYEGTINPNKVAEITHHLLNLGCYEISLGDTIGCGTAGSTAQLLQCLQQKDIPFTQLAVHFHDTYGQALANILVAIQSGIGVIDASVGGLGGCPYAKGAGGNVSTEDVLYMLQGLGIETGVDLDKLLVASNFIFNYFKKFQVPEPRMSKVARVRNVKMEGIKD